DPAMFPYTTLFRAERREMLLFSNVVEGEVYRILIARAKFADQRPVVHAVLKPVASRFDQLWIFHQTGNPFETARVFQHAVLFQAVFHLSEVRSGRNMKIKWLFGVFQLQIGTVYPQVKPTGHTEGN